MCSFSIEFLRIISKIEFFSQGMLMVLNRNFLNIILSSSFSFITRYNSWNPFRSFFDNKLWAIFYPGIFFQRFFGPLSFHSHSKKWLKINITKTIYQFGVFRCFLSMVIVENLHYSFSLSIRDFVPINFLFVDYGQELVCIRITSLAIQIAESEKWLTYDFWIFGSNELHKRL